MTERPILFSAPIIRALLAGQKTQTRRAVKPQPQHPSFGSRKMLALDDEGIDLFLHGGPLLPRAIRCPYGRDGDRLWVRESYRLCADFDRQPPSAGSAANRVWHEAHAPHQPGFGKLRPSIHMPRWASRITLEVTDVRVERLQAISEDDARAEGITDGGCLNCGNSEFSCGCLNPRPDARDSFIGLWKSINGSESWDANPWVWAISFRRIES